MADFEAPSFSLGLDLDLDSELGPRLDFRDPEKPRDHVPRNLTVESELQVSDSDPEVSAPDLKRLRRGPGRVQRVQLEEALPRCDVDEEIEEFSSQENLRRDDCPSTQYYSVCSSSKFPLRVPGGLTSQSASHRKAGTREQPSDHPSAYSWGTSSSNPIFPKLTVSPLRRFQLLDSDSDDPSVSEDANQVAGKPHLSAKVGLSNHRQYSSASEEKSTKASVSMPQNVDLWEDFWPNSGVSIHTPVLDEVCDEYFRSVKEKNATVKLGFDGCMSNKRSCPDKNGMGFVQNQFDLVDPLPPSHHYFCQDDSRIQRLVRSRLPHFSPLGGVSNTNMQHGASQLADPLPPSHRYFYHDDPRIQRLVHSRLPHFSPLGGVSNTNMQHGASLIDYKSQFGLGETSKVQVNQGISTTKARKNARKSKVEEDLNASGGFVNPKNCAGIPKKASKKQVHVDGQPSGRWYTSAEGRRVYVTKGGQELTGSIAYKSYKKESRVGFAKSKSKTTAKRASMKRRKT